MIGSGPAYAWSNQGHRAVGAIAYDLLATRDPAAIAAVKALAASHPDRARFDAALADLTGTARDRALFELIARWPDEIRKTRYNRTHWHHQLRVVVGWTLFAPLRPGKADHAVFHNLRIASDEKADGGRRAIALCWLFHVVGDMHQPLHAGHRMDERFPLTDRAGTLGWVRRTADAAPETLHHFWDEAADRPGDEAIGADAIARAAEAELAIRPVGAQEPKAAYRAAVRESEMLAASVAYRGAALAAPRRPEEAPILGEDYVAAARTLAEQRIGQAGARLADMLGRIFTGSDADESQPSVQPDASAPAPMLHPEE